MSFESSAEKEIQQQGTFEALEKKLRVSETLTADEAGELRSRILAEIEDWERMGFVKSELVNQLVESVRFEDKPSEELLAQYGLTEALGSWNPQSREWTIYAAYFQEENAERRHIGLHEIMGHALLESGIFNAEDFGNLRKLAEQTSFEQESPYVQELLSLREKFSSNPDKLREAATKANWDNPEEYLANLDQKILVEKLAERLSGWFENKRDTVPGDLEGQFAAIFSEYLGDDAATIEKIQEVQREAEEELTEEDQRDVDEQMRLTVAQSPARELAIQMAEKSKGQILEPPVQPTQSALGWIFAPLKESLRN